MRRCVRHVATTVVMPVAMARATSHLRSAAAGWTATATSTIWLRL